LRGYISRFPVEMCDEARVGGKLNQGSSKRKLKGSGPEGGREGATLLWGSVTTESSGVDSIGGSQVLGL
jgi:hypothetical protein